MVVARSRVSMVNFIEVSCSELVTGKPVPATHYPHGGESVAPNGSIGCNSDYAPGTIKGEIAIGLIGRSGGMVDALGLRCATTASVQPALKDRVAGGTPTGTGGGTGTGTGGGGTSPTTSPCDAAPTAEMKLLCTEHNRVRANHCVPALTWSKTQATNAQTSADRCPNDHNRAELKAQNENENLYNGSGSANFTGPQAAFNFWYGEKKDYHFDNPVLVFDAKENKGPVNGHFTQVVWKGTGNIGCAVKVCTNGTYYSCRYQQPGNFNAHVPETDAATAKASLTANVLNDLTCKALRGVSRHRP
jgi:hypothetical protein